MKLPWKKVGTTDVGGDVYFALHTEPVADAKPSKWDGTDPKYDHPPKKPFSMSGYFMANPPPLTSYYMDLPPNPPTQPDGSLQNPFPLGQYPSDDGLDDLRLALTKQTAKMYGWWFKVYQNTLSTLPAVAYVLICPHGNHYQESISHMIVGLVGDGLTWDQLVAPVAMTALKCCKSEHGVPAEYLAWDDSSGDMLGQYQTEMSKAIHKQMMDQLLYGYSTISTEPGTVQTLTKLFPNIGVQVLCPAAPATYDQTNPLGCGQDAISKIIMHLNDGHKWTREQIADWLETLDVDLTLPAQSVGD